MGLFLQVLTLSFCGVILSLLGIQVGGSFCTVGHSKPDDPKLPTISVTAFTIQYQINILDRQYSMWAREDYDVGANKVRMTMVRDGKEEGIIMDYRDNVIIQYSYGEPAKTTYTCTITQLNTSTSTDNFDLFGGGGIKTQSMPHLYSSVDVFKFGSKFGETYMGKATIDGLETDHWQTCMYWADDKDNFTLDYYFTTNAWTPVDSTSPKQTPVRAVMKGVKDNNGFPYKMHHIYEYLNFRTYQKLPEERFTLPLNMKCEDTMSLLVKSLPSLPKRQSYTLEIIQDDTRVVNVIYDETRQLVWSSEKGMDSIDDFNTGVHYSIHKATHFCRTRPISQEQDFDAMFSKNMTTIKGRKELFFLDGDFTFTGRVGRRGIRCNAWVRRMVWEGSNMEVEVFFSSELANYGNTAAEQKLVSITMTSDKTVITYNLFNQVSNPDMISNNPFDITSCKQGSAIIQFRMVLTFQPAGVFVKHKYEPIIYDALYQTTVNVTGVMPLQVQWADLEWDERNNQIHWFGSFLAPEPSSVRAPIVMPAGQVPVPLHEAWNNIQSYVNRGLFVVTVTVPSNIPTEAHHLTLTAVEIRKVSSNTDFIDDEVSSFSHFRVYRTSYVHNLVPDEKLTTTKALDCADLCLHRGLYECRLFVFCDVSKQCLLSSKAVNATFDKHPDCDVYSRDYTSDFSKLPGRIIRPVKAQSISNSDSVSDCANLCLHQKNIQCESFDYCATSKACYLSSNHSYEISTSKSGSSASCDHYSKRYISDYDKSLGTTLSTQLSKKVALTVNHTSAERCASICSRDIEGCLGFSYCRTSQQCQLVTGSPRKSMTAQTNSNCDVYTIKSELSFTSAHRAKPSKDESTTYSGGAMAGLGIAMLVVGVIICAGILFLLHRFSVWKVLDIK